MNKKQKYLLIDMPDGSRYKLPFDMLAKIYAKILIKSSEDLDYKEQFSKYRELYNHMYNNEKSLIGWATNNLDWCDVCFEAEQIEAPDVVDYQEGWVSGHKTVIEE